MAYGHGLAVNRTDRGVTAFVRCEMSNNLMSEEIEIDPVLRGPAFRTAKQATIKSPRGGKIIDRKGEMETGSRHRFLSFGSGLDARP